MQLQEHHHRAGRKDHSGNEENGKASSGVRSDEEEKRCKAEVSWADEVRDDVRHRQQTTHNRQTDGGSPLPLGHKGLSP
jgi:hypothetical protein